MSEANLAAGPYRIPNCRIESAFVYTVPGGFMRIPGEPQDVLARKPAIPIDLNRARATERFLLSGGLQPEPK